jgi:hypothetical protein
MLTVEIKVKEQLDPHWSEWLGDLVIAHTGENETSLSGTATDQAALYGLLTRLRDLGLTLISVSIQGPAACDEGKPRDGLEGSANHSNSVIPDLEV